MNIDGEWNPPKSYINKLWRNYGDSPNIMSDREKAIFVSIYVDRNEDLTAETFNMSSQDMRRLAKRVLYRLHVESINRDWRERLRRNHVQSMVNDTISEINSIAVDFSRLEERLQDISYKIEDTSKSLRSIYKSWLQDVDKINQECCGKEIVYELKVLCGPCGRRLSGKPVDTYPNEWIPGICGICKQHSAVISVEKFGLGSDGKPLNNNEEKTP